MNRYVADTQALIWYMMESRKLSSKAARAFRDAEHGFVQILVPSIVLVETAFIFARNRIAREILDRVFALTDATDANLRVVPLDLAVAQAARDFGPAAVPELADRVIAVTARALDLPLLTADPQIASTDLVQVIW
ncbi:MAG: PIN domain-containing protein [Sedimentisphaerales bacterium]|nr:PIN domain-containing protein [Sedimentisphaerales bacterium]